MGSKKKHFRISSALKNIIGKDLITDDFVAIFELVKNSFDANAKRVDVTFEEILSDSGSITIFDNGKGMDLVDLEKKWLFVAYSAKREGVEDYRDEIKSKRIHAGAKGIGRFSCDRLGEELTIYTRRKESEKFCKLVVDWRDFELDMSKEFKNIEVSLELVNECPWPLKSGTVIHINSLRSKWDAERLRVLKRSLEKLINPGQKNDANSFSIYLNAKEFRKLDAEAKARNESFEVVNGKVQNFLFENLELKTTSIHLEIDESGESIKTELYDRGQFVYRMLEANDFNYGDTRLSNITVKLFHLNISAKMYFTKHMGVRPVNFGSVFVYKNGFRILPIGEIGRGDVFNLDFRKQQGTSRFFGSRDLIGRIEINGDNPDFKEASSRDGGLERNQAFIALSKFFQQNVLKRLERYAIDVVKFGNIDEFNVEDLSNDFPKEEALSFIEALTKSPQIHDIEFNADLFDIVSNASEQSLNSLLKNLTKIAKGSKNTDLDLEITRINSRLTEFAKAKADAESETLREQKLREEAEKLARQEAEKARAAQKDADLQRQKTKHVTKESVFLRSLVSSDLENVVSLHHHIGIAAGTIQNYVRSTTKKIRSGKPVTAETFLSVLDEISFVASQISATTKFATKANFNLDAELIEADLCSYIEEYLLNICAGLIKIDKDVNTNLIFKWVNESKIDFMVGFRPLEISMILDGLISNAVKSGAKSVTTSVSLDDDVINIRIENDGKPIKKSYIDKLFEMGFTTTNGSGLGLHHARTIIERMKGTIVASQSSVNSTEFVIKLPR